MSSRKKDFRNINIYLRPDFTNYSFSMNIDLSKKSYPEGYLFVKKLTDYILEKNKNNVQTRSLQ